MFGHSSFINMTFGLWLYRPCLLLIEILLAVSSDARSLVAFSDIRPALAAYRVIKWMGSRIILFL